MSPTKPPPHPCSPGSADATASPISDEIASGKLRYPDARLPEAPYPYLLRTRVNKEALSDVERTTVRSCSIISRGLFPDDIFPVEPAELVVDLDKITYDLDNQRWLLDYPSVQLPPGDREREMAAFLNRFVRLAWQAHVELGEPVPDTPRQWVPTRSPRPFLDGKVDRVPGIALIDADVDPEWSDVLCDIQMVPTEDDMPEALHRLATGAFNLFASQEDRLYCVGVAIAGDSFQLVYHDRAGRVLSDATSINEDPILFARIILGLSLLDESVGGRDTSIVYRDDQRFVTVGGVEYELLETISFRREIEGSGTTCWRCRREDSSEDFVIKSVWADMERVHTEGDLLRRVSSLDGIPDLVCEEPVSRGPGKLCTTSWCEALHPMYRFATKATVPQLILRRLVLQPYARPLHDFASKEELLGAFHDTIGTHQKLYDVYDLLHCDISDNNIMLRARPGSALRQGLLIDLDFAIRVERLGQWKMAPMGYKAGTLPFMACDILRYKRITQGPRHDLESFLHVLMFICASYAGPSNTPRRDLDLHDTPMQPWLVGDGAAKDKIMRVYSDDEFRAFLDAIFHPYFDDLKDVVCDMRKIVMCRDETPRHEEMLDVLDRHIKARRFVLSNRPISPPTSPRTSPIPSSSETQASPKRKRPSAENRPSSQSTSHGSAGGPLPTPSRTPRSTNSCATEVSERTLFDSSCGVTEQLSGKMFECSSSAPHSPKRQKMV